MTGDTVEYEQKGVVSTIITPAEEWIETDNNGALWHQQKGKKATKLAGGYSDLAALTRGATALGG